MRERFPSRPSDENRAPRSPHEADSSQQRVNAMVDFLDGVLRESRKQGISLYREAGPCPAVLDVPELSKAWWVANDRAQGALREQGFIPAELERVSNTYVALRGNNEDPGPLPYIKAEVESLAARAAGRADKLLSKRDERVAYKLHDAVSRALKVAHDDLALTVRRTFEAQDACMQLRTDDLELVLDPESNKYVNSFKYVRNDEVWVSNLFAGGKGHIRSYNNIQFAQLQLMVSTYTNYLFAIRQKMIQPRLGELTALHESLDRLLVGQTDLQDAWPRKGNFKRPPMLHRNEQMKYMYPRFKNVRNVPLGDGRNVYAFIDNAERYCKHEVHMLEMKLKIKGWQANALLTEADKVLDAPRQGALPLQVADAFTKKAREMPRAIVALREEQKLARALARRVNAVLENRRSEGNVQNAFAPVGVLLTPDDGARAYAYNAYAKISAQLGELDTQLDFGIRKIVNIDASIRKRVIESLGGRA